MLHHIVKIYGKDRRVTELSKDEESNFVTIKQENDTTTVDVIVVDVFELSKAVMAITSGNMFTAFGNHNSTEEQP